LNWTAEGKGKELKVKEVHAEAASYVVANYFKIRNPFSSDYLQHWGNTPKDLVAGLNIVRHTSAFIIARLEKGRDGVNPVGASD
jgi:hypothetical protein